MNLSRIKSFHGGLEIWKEYNELEWLEQAFEAPNLIIKSGATEQIRSHLELQLQKDGWALKSPVSNQYDLEITAKKQKLGFQIQTGNISRAAYDLLKLQTMYLDRIIEAACLAVPTQKAANILGGNLANENRLIKELNLFDRHITLPLILLSFE